MKRRKYLTTAKMARAGGRVEDLPGMERPPEGVQGREAAIPYSRTLVILMFYFLLLKFRFNFLQIIYFLPFCSYTVHNTCFLIFAYTSL